MASREELTRLTDRWRRRHDARRPSDDERPAADPEREALAAAPSRSTRSIRPRTSPSTAPAWSRFTYDEARYADPDLDAWLLEVGRLLRARR